MKKLSYFWFLLILPPLLVWQLPLWKVKNIQVFGVPSFYEPILQKDLQALYNQSFLIVTLQDIEKYLSQSPFIVKKLEKKIPDTLCLTLTPRKALFSWNGKWWDWEGKPASPLVSSQPPVTIKGDIPSKFLVLLGQFCNTCEDLCVPGVEVVYHSPYHVEWKMPGGTVFHFTEEQCKTLNFPRALLDVAGTLNMDLRLSRTWVLRDIKEDHDALLSGGY